VKDEGLDTIAEEMFKAYWKIVFPKFDPKWATTMQQTKQAWRAAAAVAVDLAPLAED